MRFVLVSHAAIALCAALIFLLFFGLHEALSFAMGALVMWGDLAIMAIGLPFIFAKKQIALSVSVIVFKFAILAWIMNEAVKAASPMTANSHFYLGWFAGGIALINVSALVTAVKLSRS